MKSIIIVLCLTFLLVACSGFNFTCNDANIKNLKNEIEKYHWLDKLANILNTDIKYMEEEMKNIEEERYVEHSYINEEKNIIKDDITTHV